MHFINVGNSGRELLSRAPVVASAAVRTDCLETQLWDGVPATPCREVIDLDTPEKSKVKREELDLSPKPMAVEPPLLADPVVSPGPEAMEVDAPQLAEPVVAPTSKPMAPQLAEPVVSPAPKPIQVEACLEPVGQITASISAHEMRSKGLFCYAGMIPAGENPLAAKPMTSQAVVPASPDSPEPTPSPKPTPLLYKDDFSPEKVADIQLKDEFIQGSFQLVLFS